MIRTRLVRLLRGPFALLLTAVLLAFAPSPSPAAAAARTSPLTDWSVSLAAANPVLTPGLGTMLTATANQDVGGDYLEIFNLDTGALVNDCFSGTVCTSGIPVTSGTGTIFDYQAVISSVSTPNIHDLNVLAGSNRVTVTWLTMSLVPGTRVTTTGSSVTLTALTNANVGRDYNQFNIEVFDTTTGASLAACKFGTVCSATVSQAAAGTHAYTALVAAPGAVFPPSDVRAQASTNVGWGTVTLATSSNTASVGSPVTLTATSTLNVSSPSPAYIEIWDASAGKMVTTQQQCGSGTTCSVTLSPGIATRRDYVAALVFPASTTSPTVTPFPPAFAALSSSVTVAWA